MTDYLPTHFFVGLSVCLSACLLSVCLSVRPCVHLFRYPVALHWPIQGGWGWWWGWGWGGVGVGEAGELRNSEVVFGGYRSFKYVYTRMPCNYVPADGGRYVVACPSRALAVLYWMLTIFACHVLTYVWDAVSIFNHLHRMLSTDLAFRITDWTNCHRPHMYMLY